MANSQSIRIGTRGSRLALIQASHVEQALRLVDPNIWIETVTITSVGDDHAEAPLSSLGVGVFTSSLERSLRNNQIDIAVHSMKDLPTQQDPALKVLSILEREDPRDTLINRWHSSLLDLPPGARIGTSSPRRVAQLMHGRSDLIYEPVRGNVETRLKKAVGSDFDGVILAAAGVKRLGLQDQIDEFLSIHICTPAPGQGAIGIQVRADDLETFNLAHQLIDQNTSAAVNAERSLLRAAGGGCQLPVGACAEILDDQIRLFATVTPTDGSVSYRTEVTGNMEDSDLLGVAAYHALIDQGAGPLLNGSRS